MNERDDSLKNLRIELDISTEEAKPIEAFQSKTLRPILKFQNPLIIQLFKDYLNKNHKTFRALNQKIQFEIISESLKKDQGLKCLLINIIVGFFTYGELEFYLKNNSELNKRISTMLIKRLEDQISRLII